MDLDWNQVRANFAGMSREELIEELALRLDTWTSQARLLLEGEACSRGISGAELDELRRRAGAPPKPGVGAPALLTSCVSEGEARDLARTFRERGIAAVVRETDFRFHRCSGIQVGRWGLFVPGDRADEASRLLDNLVPAENRTALDSAACGSCATGEAGDGGCTADDGKNPPLPDEEAFPEDGDWWKTADGPLEGDERDR